jgi:glycosyltransferase involved in cell wall biosynthesis
MVSRIAFIVNGGPQSAMGIRAQSFKERLSPTFDIAIAHRVGNKLYSALRFLAFLHNYRPDAVYVFDMSASGVLAALTYKTLTKTPAIVDTGDVISEVAHTLDRGPLGQRFTQFLETISLRCADHIVVRGTNHRTLLQNQGINRVSVLQDGIDLTEFYPQDTSFIRQQHGLENRFVVGLLGSSHWNPKLRTCYGWDMLDALYHLQDLPIHALMIGGGSGLSRLKDKSHRSGIADRVTFTGHIPYHQLPEYINAIDVCLSKQTNDLVGQVRTTGKLPLYMACGKFVLATRVGEAAHILPDSMLIDYDGSHDPSYSKRLANRLRSLVHDPDLLHSGAKNRVRAAQHFDYDLLSERMAYILSEYL